MSEANLQENWEVEVGGKIYFAEPSELPGWIDEGSLLRGDKVRKGNLRWIEAGRVPSLIPFFNAKEKGEPSPFVQKFASPEPTEGVSHDQTENVVDVANITSSQPAQIPLQQTNSFENVIATEAGTSEDVCLVHHDRPSFYVCSGCNSVFCKGCPKSFGGTVRICLYCDALCKPIKEVAEAAKKSAAVSGHINEGFGAGDFFAAVSYPLKFKSSLIFGSLMFMFFTLGQSAASIGGIFMIVASLFCLMLANMLTFGVLTNTIENFTQGRLEADFMPDFDDFSIWDSVIHPFLLSIAAYISSFGPFFIAMAIGGYLIFSSIAEQSQKFEAELARVPGTQYYGPDRTLEQSQEVKDLLDKVKIQNQRRIEQQTQTANGGPAISGDGSTDIQELIEQSKQTNAATPIGTTASSDQQYSEMLIAALRLAAPLVVIGAITFLWGLFYFPAACAVAGYSRSFIATINPMVGLDTIKRLGGSYFKILLMGLCILIFSAILNGLAAVLFSPFDLPKLGNVPAKVVGSIFTFYFSIVFSCILGLAMYKASDRLKLYK